LQNKQGLTSTDSVDPVRSDPICWITMAAAGWGAGGGTARRRRAEVAAGRRRYVKSHFLPGFWVLFARGETARGGELGAGVGRMSWCGGGAAQRYNS
jgi:hypothetical protein